MINTKKSIAVTLAVLVSFLVRTPARGSEMDELKATVQAMQKNMRLLPQPGHMESGERHTNPIRARGGSGKSISPKSANDERRSDD